MNALTREFPLVIGLVAGLFWGAVCSVQAAAPVDPKLAAAYRKIHFTQLYPPEAVRLVDEAVQPSTQPLVQLKALAKHQDSHVRVLVAMLLGDLGDPEGGRSLWDLLRDPDETVRLSAAGSLYRLRQLTPIPVALDGLKDEHPEIRRLTAATLAQFRDKAAESALLDATKDNDEGVRSEVVRALSPGNCGTAQSLPTLIDMLQDKSVLVREWVVGVLGNIHDPVVEKPLLESMTKDPDWHVRAAAAMALSDWVKSDPQVIPPLIRALQEDEFALPRDRAAGSLMIPEDDKAVAALVQAIGSKNRDARAHAAASLIVGKITAALPQLLDLRTNENATVRAKVIEIFGELGNTNQLSVIAEATNDPDPAVQVAAIQALRKLRERGGNQFLLSRLTDPNPHVRSAAIRVLGDMGDKSVSGQIIPLLRDDNGFVRAAAAEALGKLGDRSALVPLIKLLTGEDLNQIIGTSGQEGLIVGPGKEYFTGLAQLDPTQRRTRAAEALGVLGAPEAIDALINGGLKAGDPTLRAVSAYALGQIGDPRAVGPLQEAVRPFYEAAPEVTGFVITTGNATVPDVERQRLEKETRVRASVAWALGKIGDPSARPMLLKAIERDPNSLVVDAAREALARIVEREEKDREKQEAAASAVKP
jgi:HEAT repeat protein